MTPITKQQVEELIDRLADKSLTFGHFIGEKEKFKKFALYGEGYLVSNLGRVKNGRKIMRSRLDNNGYPTIQLCHKCKHKKLNIHNMIAASFGMGKADCIDHVNGLKTDSRLSNLQPCTYSENNHKKPAQKNNALGVKGVYWDKDRNMYKAQIMKDGKKIALGRYIHLEDAKRAHDEKAKELYGEFSDPARPDKLAILWHKAGGCHLSLQSIFEEAEWEQICITCGDNDDSHYCTRPSLIHTFGEVPKQPHIRELFQLLLQLGL